MKQVLLKQLSRMALLLFAALLVPMGAQAEERIDTIFSTVSGLEGNHSAPGLNTILTEEGNDWLLPMYKGAYCDNGTVWFYTMTEGIEGFEDSHTSIDVRSKFQVTGKILEVMVAVGFNDSYAADDDLEITIYAGPADEATPHRTFTTTTHDIWYYYIGFDQVEVENATFNVRFASKTGREIQGVLLREIAIEYWHEVGEEPEPEPVVVYDLAIAETPVTSVNCNDIPSAGIVSGKVSFDPATSTLTLDNANITNWVGAAQGWLTRNHFTDENEITPVENLTIKLIGTNVAESAEIGIWLDQINVTIMSEDGTGVLQYNNFVDTNTEPEFPMGSCIQVGNLTIDNCTVHAGQSVATQVGDENGKLTVINNGLVSAFDGIGFGSYEFGEGIGIVQPAGATIGESGVDYDGEAKGIQHIVIGHVEATPDPVEPVLAFNKDEVTVTRGMAFYAPTLNNPAQLPLTWSSSDETVATVDQNGHVEIGQCGETTISAAFAGNDQYLAKTASYRIIVEKPTPRLSFGNFGLEFPFMLRLTQEQLDNDYQYPLVVDIPAKCIFMNLDDVSPITWSSDNEAIYVDDNFMLHATAAGEAIITVSFAGDDDWAPVSAQLKVVIEQQEPVEPITEETEETPADTAVPGEATTSDDGVTTSLGEDDEVDTAEGSVTLHTTLTTDEVKELLERYAPGSSPFVDTFKGIFFLLSGGTGTIEMDVQTLGDYVMKMMKGTEFIGEYIKDTKGTVTINYNNTEDTWYFAFTGESESAASARRAGAAADGGLKVYRIKITPAGGPSAIFEINAETGEYEVYNLQGQRVTSPVKGLFIINGKKVVIK